ncbi:hypothetical protein ABN028_10775 [Actinopolymorpha sp. B17G11]|uniref:hypothetical protein n=1 Tax=Actinopolymorpha sp. B17G11 TaxID=3160861 RepID=UPI0032E41A31
MRASFAALLVGGSLVLVSSAADPVRTEPAAQPGTAPVSLAAGSASSAPPDRCQVSPTVLPFGTSSPAVTRRANQFWTVYGLGEGGPEAPGSPLGANSAWTEWDARKFAWTDQRGHRDRGMERLLTLPINGSNGVTGKQPDGFPWSWADLETWPDTNDRHGGVGSYHFDQIPRFINATYDYYVWTRDEEFLARALPRAELIMERYVLPVLGGDDGIWTIPLSTNDGVADRSRPSTYFDQLRSGHQDAWVNAAAYTALLDMARLERLAGKPDQAARYAALAEAFPAKYDKAFWNNASGMYAGWRDAEGNLHDSGYLHVNLEALARGLGDPERARSVFSAMAAPADPIAFGPHTGSTDVYQNVVAPRTTTGNPPDSDWDGWSDPAQGRKPYGDTVQHGGTVLWLSYYDVMARLRHQDADHAYARFVAMLDRMAADSHCLTFDAPNRLYNDFGESLVQVGSNIPFPESGIAALPLLEGFAGVEATPAGLQATPNLPSALVDARVSQIDYAGQSVSVDVSRARVVARSEPVAGPQDLAPGASVAREFDASTPFNQAQVQVSATHGGRVTVALERRVDDSWVHVAARRHDDLASRATWLDLAVPAQAPGRYRLLTIRPGTDGPLPHPEGEGGGGMTLAAVRVLDAAQEDVTPPSLAAGGVVTNAPVDRFTVDLGTATDEPVALTLQRRIGKRWVSVAAQVLDPAGGRQVVVGTSDQPAGHYRFVATDDSAQAGVVLTRLERARYTVEAPELEVRTTAPAGEPVTLAAPPDN